MLSEQNSAKYHFTCGKENFKNEKTIRETLRNPVENDEDSLKVVSIRPGMHIATVRVNPQVIPRYGFDLENLPLCFAFHLSGKLETFVERWQDKQPTSIVNQRGVNSLGRAYEMKGYSQYLSREILTAVILYIDPLMFIDLIAEELDGIPQESRDILRPENFFLSLPMTCEMYNAAARALYHPYTGTAARLYLESCGLELLTLQIDRFTQQNMQREKTLGRADEERVRMAGDILMRQMESPPTIPELAMQVGVSSTKLKRGFKQVFGVSIGQFLLQHRMTRARELIINRQIDVTQASFSVGYSNVSHFIRCYKKTYGVTPGCDKQPRDNRILPA